MKTKIFLFFYLLIICYAVPQYAYKDWTKAKKQALKENKPILLILSGSTWCPPCIKLNKTILEKKQFEKSIDGKIIFVYIDYPAGGTNISPEQDSLLKIYNPKGMMPWVGLLDSSAKPIKKINIYKNGAFTSLEQFRNDILSSSQKLEQMVNNFMQSNSNEKKAQALVLFLNSLPPQFLTHHQEKITQLKSLSHKKYASFIQEKEIQKKFLKVRRKVSNFLHQKKLLKARNLLKKNIKEFTKPQQKQALTFYQIYTYNKEKNRHKSILEILNQTIAIAPNSPFAKKARKEKKKIQNFLQQSKK